jgi:hypothetical protein
MSRSDSRPWAGWPMSPRPGDGHRPIVGGALAAPLTAQQTAYRDAAGAHRRDPGSAAAPVRQHEPGRHGSCCSRSGPPCRPSPSWRRPCCAWQGCGSIRPPTAPREAGDPHRLPRALPDGRRGDGGGRARPDRSAWPGGRRTASGSRSPHPRMTAVEQWVADANTGDARRVATGVNEAAGGCQWMPDSRRLLCLLVPADRGAPPAAPRTPAGPTVQETPGGRRRSGPIRTCSRTPTTRRSSSTT